MKREKKNVWKGLLRACAWILALVLLLGAGGIGWLSLREYRPQSIEEVQVAGAKEAKVQREKSLTLLDWNIGYAALGKNADFFMDGGTSVSTADKEKVQENMDGLLALIESVDPDLLFLQEVDRCSARTYRLNEVEWFETQLGHASAFASNFLVDFVPYPIPPIGKVDSGILTLSAYDIAEAQRVQLPIPFSWPTRTANLKRCVLICRMPVEGSEKELVLVNLHLEAYDDGEGKKMQAEMLGRILQEEADRGNYVIAGGDFNQTFSSIDLSLFPIQEGMWSPSVLDLSEYDAQLQCLMDEHTPSCRSLDRAYEGADLSTFQYYVIDGFIVSENVEVERFEVLDQQFEYSDHNPLVLQFRLN